MKTYPIHPIAAIYPPLPEKEFAKLKEHIKANGLQNAIVLYEEQVLDGVHRQRACEETNVEARYDRPEIKDPIAYVIGQNERRRHLTKDQLAVVASKLANMPLGGELYKIGGSHDAPMRISRDKAAKAVGVSPSSVQRVRYAQKHGIPEVIPAIEAGKITAWDAREIALLPKTEQSAALESTVKKIKQPKRSKAELTPEEATKDAACLEYINQPSIYPVDAHIPEDGADASRLRQAIAWLREHEPRIQFFKSQKECDELLRCTNAIASYRDNWFRAPRLEGELDPRILEWQQTLWRKRLRQQERIDLQRQLRHRSQPKMSPVKRKVRLPFDERFDIFWSKIESSLKTFKSSEQQAVVRAFRKKLSEFFSEILAERNGSCRVADHSNSETEIVAIR